MFNKKEYNKRYYKANKEEQLERNRKWRKKNPDNVEAALKRQRDKEKAKDDGKGKRSASK